MPTGRIVHAIADRLDRAIGVGKLRPIMRAQLLTEQIQAIINLTPMMTAGAVFVSLLVLSVTADEAVFPFMVIWAGTLAIMLFRGMAAWRRSKGRELKRVASPNAVRRAVYNAAIMGTLWGLVPILLLPSDQVPVRLVAGIAIAGVLCASGFALSVLPAVAIAFTVPVVIGSFWAVSGLDNAAEIGALAALLGCFVVVMPFIGTRLARNFAQHLVSESLIREQKDIISLLLKEFEENACDWLWEFDRNGKIDRVSERFATAAGQPADLLVGRDFCGFLRNASTENGAIMTEIEQDMARYATFHDVVVKLEEGGDERWWRLTGKPAFDDLGAYSGYIGTASDITAERLAERKINFLAHNDPLTGLLNRAKFTDYLKQCVSRLERYGSPFSVLYLDLDQFKAVNDSRGHMIGDKLLAQVSVRIRAIVREADIAARLGGDEFAIILSSNCDATQVAKLAQRLIDSISKPYELDDELITIGVSVGIAMAPVNGTRPDQILRNADLALYRAKAEGRGVFRFFETQMDSDVRERRMLELELRNALKDGEFVLHYQPLVSAEDDKPGGFEALVRWNHPIRGIVPPAEFIPIAEQTGLINQIGDWTIREACMAAVRWPQDLMVAVNLSARHFQTSDIADVVRDALEASNLTPHRLELEITESLLIERPDDVIEKLSQIKALGVTIAMDDFGTGYSSLSYLLKFPFDKIKIDKSFVSASSEDAVARDILRSIASLGKTLKINITAEGVETQQQVDFLREIACQQLQGFYFAKPLNEADLASFFLSRFNQDIDEPVETDPVRTISG